MQQFPLLSQVFLRGIQLQMPPYRLIVRFAQSGQIVTKNNGPAFQLGYRSPQKDSAADPPGVIGRAIKASGGYWATRCNAVSTTPICLRR